MMWWLWVLLLLLLCLILLHFYMKNPRMSVRGRHVMVTGGSSGIGFAVAEEALKRGASCVTILARHKTLLAQAAHTLQTSAPSSLVQTFSLDVTRRDLDTIEDVINQAESSAGPIDLLINCAGTSISCSFLDTKLEDFYQVMNVNYFGTLHMCKCVVRRMKERRCGRVVVTSSVAGQFGLYGYTAYASSKYALRGLAESLRMELKPYNIYVSLVFPPDTDTPGYKLEQMSKPEETELISKYGGLFLPSEVARVMLGGVERGDFLVPVGFDGWMMSSISCGMTSASVLEVTCQVLLLGVFRLVALYYQKVFDGIVRRCALKRDVEESGKRR